MHYLFFDGHKVSMSVQLHVLLGWSFLFGLCQIIDFFSNKPCNKQDNIQRVIIVKINPDRVMQDPDAKVVHFWSVEERECHCFLY